MRKKNDITINGQLLLIDDHAIFPSTRYQGSKLKITDWIWDSIKHLSFYTALDAFGGSGSVAYMMKLHGKEVTYNDLLKFNYYIGLALIENNEVKLNNEDVEFVLAKHSHIEYPSFIYDTFKEIYFTDEENSWIDQIVTNIKILEDPFKKAIAYFALFQSCTIKRPFNLFHRKNLYIRLSNVKRNFGNKTTWDTSFETHFRHFINEANEAIFSNGRHNKALNENVFDITENFDLIYIDTPYISNKGIGVDYLAFYHFLEGLVNYNEWHKIIDYKSKHKKIKSPKSPWADKKVIHSYFDQLFRKFEKSVLVVSYRSDGIPSVEELVDLLKKYKSEVHEIKRKNYKYVLSNNHSEEILLIGT